MKKISAWLLAMVLLCGLTVSAIGEITPYTKCGTHGTAKRLAGRTAIVSIFASDTRWDWDIWDEDLYTYSSVYFRLGHAADWLMDQARSYGVNCELIWNWMDPGCGDLCQLAYFDHKMLNGDTAYASDYYDFIGYIDSLDNDAIMRNHHAENILYMFYFNTEKPGQGWTGYAMPSYGELASNVGAYEYVVLPIGDNYPPGTYAHEILHLFGAPDIYGASADWGFSDSFVNDFHHRYPREIMGGATSYNYDEVNYVLSPLVAYYVGLARSSRDQQDWGLRRSEYELYGY